MKAFILAILAMGISFSAQANDCEVAIESNDQMRFTSDTISVPASCSEVTLTLTHTGKLPAQSMGHNIVIIDSANLQAVAIDGMNAGFDNNYVKPNDPRVYAASDIIGGGESTSVTFSTANMSADGDYSFVCTFPGHWAIMKGKFQLL